MTVLYVVLAAVIIIVLWLVALYNGLVKLNNRAKEGWSDIDVQLKRRHDLIPNLVNSVKGYMTHERELLENITKARTGAMSAQETGNKVELGKLENQLSGMLGKLQIAVEAYPDLKASQNVGQLMDELSDTENKIQAARRFYNGLARDFNTKMEVFPNNLFASLLKFARYEFFAADEGEKQNVEVKL